jgi:3',5'-cyclic AMP phosphodiesterase CpdA
MARFLHLSDLHVVPEGQLVSGQLDTAGLLRVAIDTLIHRLDAIGPVDAVIVSGDISDDGSAESYEIAGTRAIGAQVACGARQSR